MGHAENAKYLIDVAQDDMDLSEYQTAMAFAIAAGLLAGCSHNLTLLIKTMIEAHEIENEAEAEEQSTVSDGDQLNA